MAADASGTVTNSEEDTKAAKAATISSDRMIIDVHSHDFAPTVATRAMAGMCRVLEGRLTPSGDGTLENHLDHLDHAGVDKAVMCPIATKPGHFEVIFRRSCRIMSGEAGERAQRKIIPFASVHPDDPDALKHLEEIAHAGIRGVKFHPYYQNFSLADPSVWPLFAKTADLGLVVQCHAGRDLGYWARRDACGPKEIATLLRNVRGLKFIAAHLGGCLGYEPHATDDLLELGCYVDTSALAQNMHYDEQMRILRSWPRERILFATDFPWTHYPESIAWVRSVRDPADWELVFSSNAELLLFSP